VTFTIAVFVSLAIHVPAFEGIAKLGEWRADALAGLLAAARTEPIELEITETPPPPEEEPELAPTPPVEPEPPRDRAREREPERPPEPTRMVEVPVVPAPPRPVRPPVDARHAVRQRSTDPSAVPDNPQYIAEENNRVEEETAARVTNTQIDDPETQLAEADASEDPTVGNADAAEQSDLRDATGAPDRAPTPREAVIERPLRAATDPLPNVEARGENDQRALERRAGREEREESPATMPTEVHDTDGNLAVAIRESILRDRAPTDGTDAAEAGLEGRDRRGADRRSRRGRGRGTGMVGPDLRVSWREFEDAVGQRELDEERERYVAERRSRIRGSNREREWRQFRSAIENYTPNVRPGNQTALNTAASPFATYLADVHQRIHREFAHGFLPGLPAGGDSPFADQTLYTRLEIILNRDGSVHRVGVVRPSGLLPFDLGAFRSVMRAQPYPQPPSSILSGDGRVYLHWGFNRNGRQCTTANAEPYILANPPGSARPTSDAFADQPSRGNVVPMDAVPTWGTELGPAGDEAPASPPAEEAPGERAPSEEAPPEPAPIAPPSRPPSLPPLDGELG
jgi:hypothetical protein